MKKKLTILLLSSWLALGAAGCSMLTPNQVTSLPQSESEVNSDPTSEPTSQPTSTPSSDPTSEPTSEASTSVDPENYVWGYQTDKNDEIHEDQVDFATGKVTNDVSGKKVEVTTIPNLVDYVSTGGLTLNLDYAGHDFWTEGIGKVTLKTAIDGDTAHFYPVVTTTSNAAIKSRFWGIDTPESTGRIQQWGKGASSYTKSILKEANEKGTLVVSTAQDTYAAPIPDSTGSRYVSLIWYSLDKKDCPYTELKLLNLAIVQNGYSWVKNVSDMPVYQSVFYAAEAQARNIGIHLWSKLDDPAYPEEGVYTVCSLLDLKREIQAGLADSTYQSPYNNTRIVTTGTVAGYADGTLYLQDYFSADDGYDVDPNSLIDGLEYAGINCFCGMSAVPSKYTTIGTYLKIYGVVEDTENFGFQVTGLEGHFPSVTSLAAEGDVEIILKATENVDDKAYKELT
ncbi:MAG: thermonuclease family protein, partial [Bacilli bacterium]|nr:thermonuclease family protein [Bacilli bacterium]